MLDGDIALGVFSFAVLGCCEVLGGCAQVVGAVCDIGGTCSIQDPDNAG